MDPSCGSIFRAYPGVFSGKLVRAANAPQATVGASISAFLPASETEDPDGDTALGDVRGDLFFVVEGAGEDRDRDRAEQRPDSAHDQRAAGVVGLLEVEPDEVLARERYDLGEVAA